MHVHDALMVTSIAIAALNVAITIAVAVNPGYNARQKALQILIIWVVPFFGGLFLGLFLFSQRGRVPPSGYASLPKDDAVEVWSALHSPDRRD